MKHILTTAQFLDKKVLENIFALASQLEQQNKEGGIPQSLHGKIIATVFYEPSTRTRFSFETAMLKLGGHVITTENARDFSSAIKGETIQDTVRVIGNYTDAIILRHPEKGTALKASKVSPVPIVNAGDGSGEHPTQALLDLYTIQKEVGRIDGLTIGLVGDLLYGRTIHSLIILLSIFTNVTLYLISPIELKLPKKYINILIRNGIRFVEMASMEENIADVNVLYITRIQKERFASLILYEKIKDSFVVTQETLQKLSATSIIMHPLPRVNEIATEVDIDARAAYFRQASNGLYIRMALLKMLLT